MSNEELEDSLAKLSREELLALPTIAALLSNVREFTVTALPEEYAEHTDASSYKARVVWRSEGKWAVNVLGSQIDINGEAGYESLPSTRTKKYLKRFRFDLPTALAIAEEAVKHISVNGISVESFVKWEEARKQAEAEMPEASPDAFSRRFYEVLREMNPDNKLRWRIDRGLEELDKKSQIQD